MYYKKDTISYSPQTYTYNLSDFSRGMNKEVDENLLSMNYADIAYNVKLDDKALKNGYGIKELEVPDLAFEGQMLKYKLPENTNPLGLWSFKVANNKGEVEDIILLYCDNKKLYYTYLCDIADFFIDTNITLESMPTILTYMLNGLETVIICSPQDPMYTWNGTATPVNSEKALHFSSMCIHYERLFATSSDQKNEIRFSQDFDVTNWEETSDAGGFIQLVDERGNVNKVISFNDYVYIIRDYGISRLSAYGEQSEFSVTHLNLSSNRIYSNTAVMCGDRIILLTSNGLHYCAGGSLYKYDFKINSMINKDYMQYANAIYYNNKYYLATRIDFDDGKTIGCESESDFKNNVLIEFDIDTQNINITRGVDICAMCVMIYEDLYKLTFLFRGENSQMIGELTSKGTLFGENLQKTWKSPLSDLGTQKTKVVKSITLQTDEEVSVTVASESEQQTKTIKPYKKSQTIQCNVVGSKISIEFATQKQNFNISNPTITIDVKDD